MNDLSRWEMPPTKRNSLILDQTIVNTRCRACSSPITPAYSLGSLFVNDFPISLRDRGPKVPLTLALCDNPACELIQLTHTVPRDALYRTHYWYRSGVNETMRQELRDIVSWAMRLLKARTRVTVMDIGANDGTLLLAAADLLVGFLSSTRLIAWEPAVNMHEKLEQALAGSGAADVVLRGEFFPAPGADPHKSYKADLIFSIAMFYDLQDPLAFVRAVAGHLAADGIWTVQFQDWAAMLRTNGLDCLCHEHLEYYSLKPVLWMAGLCGLEVIDAAFSRSNGGSLRLAFAHRGAQVNRMAGVNKGFQEVADTYAAIDQMAVSEQLAFFQSRCQSVREELWSFVERMTRSSPIDLLGASTKGNTLLQWLDLGPERVRAALERAPEKFGRRTITGIPIESDEQKAKPEAVPAMRLVLPWHFRDSLVKREQRFLKAGGRLLLPLPIPRLEFETHGTLDYKVFVPHDYPPPPLFLRDFIRQGGAL